MPPEIIKIAIADDHPVIRKGLVELIHRFSDNIKVVIQAENGRSLIDQLAIHEKPDICLIDINMPVMNGYEAISTLKVLYPQMKFLVFTMLHREYSIIKMIKHGANGYILKGSPLDEIFAALSAIYTHGNYYSEIASEEVYNVVNQIKFTDLTEQEITVLKHLCSDLSFDDIATALSISVHTLYSHKKSVCKKLGLKTRTDLALFAVQNGFIDM